MVLLFSGYGYTLKLIIKGGDSMSVLYGSLTGQAKTVATRRGNKKSGITGHIRTWDKGVEIIGVIGIDGQVKFDVYETGGSQQPGRIKVIATI